MSSNINCAHNTDVRNVLDLLSTAFKRQTRRLILYRAAANGGVFTTYVSAIVNLDLSKRAGLLLRSMFEHKLCSESADSGRMLK